jgi:hypothetical protein
MPHTRWLLAHPVHALPLGQASNAEKALLAPDLYAPLLQTLTLSKRLRGEARSQGYWAAFAYGSVPWKHRAAEECVVLVSLLVPVSVFGFRQPYSPTGQETTVTREDSEYG